MMDAEDLSEIMTDMRHEAIDMIVEKHIPSAYAEQWDAAGLKESIAEILNLDNPVERNGSPKKALPEDDVRQRLIELSDKAAAEKRALPSGNHHLCPAARSCCRRSTACGASISSTSTTCAPFVGFRGYAQRDPLQEYKSEAFELFQALLNNMRQVVTSNMSRVEIVQEPQPQELPPMQAHHIDGSTGEELASPCRPSWPRHRMNVTRTSHLGLCRSATSPPCGSGKKYKQHCHGAR